MVKAWHEEQKFLLIDPETAPKASEGRAFIFLILLNEKDNPKHPPIAVGYTQNLQRRLSNHQAVNWHLKEYKEKPLIWVAGTCSLETAKERIRSLELALARKHVLLVGHKIASGRPHLERLSKKARRGYFYRLPSLDVTVLKWINAVRLKTKQSPGDGGGRPEAASVAAVTENEVIPNPSPEDLLEAVKTQGYKNHGAAVLVSQKLARRYDPETGFAWFQWRYGANEKRNAYTLKEAEKVIQSIAHDWRLVSDTPIDLRETQQFELTVNLKRKLHRANH